MRGNVEAVDCELKYSGVGTALVVGAALATLGLLCVTPMSMALRAALMFYVVTVAARAVVESARVKRIRFDGLRRIEIGDRDGGRRAGVIRDGGFVAPWLVILLWRPDGRRLSRTLVIFPDMADAETLRRARVLLRWA
jgi:hypothetical protein